MTIFFQSTMGPFLILLIFLNCGPIFRRRTGPLKIILRINEAMDFDTTLLQSIMSIKKILFPKYLLGTYSKLTDINRATLIFFTMKKKTYRLIF